MHSFHHCMPADGALNSKTILLRLPLAGAQFVEERNGDIRQLISSNYLNE
ncbi:hypothetical protein [Ignatzschineria cameli]|nr:hypothetical protein [Ignatzschineria cameli]